MTADDLLDLDLATWAGPWRLIRFVFLEVRVADGFLVLEDLTDRLGRKVGVRLGLVMVDLRVFVFFLRIASRPLTI